MVNKTFTKILSLGLGIVVVMSALTVAIFHINYEKQAKSNLKSIATIVSAEINANDDYSFVNDKFNDSTRLTVIDSNGTVLADSQEDVATMENHSNRPEFVEALQNGEGSTIRKSATIDENTYYYAIKLDNGNVLRVAVTSKSVFMIFYQSLIYIAIVALVVLLLSLVISYAITKSIVKPITDIGNNLDKIDTQEPIEELKPFVDTLKEHEHNKILLDKQRKEFTANVSHELKTPLTSIAGYAELIETGIAKPEDVKPFAHTIRSQALRLVTLTEDIIKLSQLDEAQNNQITFESVNLYDICQNAIDALTMNANSKGVTLKLNGAEQYINGNVSLIEELVYNLIDNAIKYNKQDGYVVVSINSINSSKTVLTVEDTGIGIPEEYQNRIFERFFRVDKSRSKATGGTGLGLAIVKHIADLHHAKIDLQSQTNIGTTISVTFNQ